MVTSDCKAWIKWPVLSSPVLSTALILMVNSYLHCMVRLSENRKRAYMESPVVCQTCIQKPDCAGISLAGFQTKIAVFGEVSYLLCSVTMWAVMLQCPLTNNSMSYFSQGFQSSCVQDLKECHAVGAELTSTERNRKRWQPIFEIIKHVDSRW